MKILHILFGLCFIFFSIQSALAKITVVSVKGEVAYKAGAQWLPLQQGMMLAEGMKISTGVRSFTILRIDDHTITIKPLTIIKVYENKSTDKSSDTTLALRRGSINAKIAKNNRVKTIFKITTPVATSSVRGTEETVSYGPGNGMTIKVIEGRVEGEGLNGIKKSISDDLVFKQKVNVPDSESIMDPVTYNSVIKIIDARNITAEEKGSRDMHPQDLVDSNEGPESIVNENNKENASANLLLIWR